MNRGGIVLRQEAIKIIIENDITKLTRDEREAMLLNSWGIDEDDPEFHFFRNLCRMNCLVQMNQQMI